MVWRTTARRSGSAAVRTIPGPRCWDPAPGTSGGRGNDIRRSAENNQAGPAAWVLRLFIRRVRSTDRTICSPWRSEYSTWSRRRARPEGRQDLIVVVSTIYEGAGPTRDRIAQGRSRTPSRRWREPLDQELPVEGACCGRSSATTSTDLQAAADGLELRLRHHQPEDAKEPVTEKVDINAEPFMTITTRACRNWLRGGGQDPKVARRSPGVREGRYSASAREINVTNFAGCPLRRDLSEVISTLSVIN